MRVQLTEAIKEVDFVSLEAVIWNTFSYRKLRLNVLTKTSD